MRAASIDAAGVVLQTLGSTGLDTATPGAAEAAFQLAARGPILVREFLPFLRVRTFELAHFFDV